MNFFKWYLPSSRDRSLQIILVDSHDIETAYTPYLVPQIFNTILFLFFIYINILKKKKRYLKKMLKY